MYDEIIYEVDDPVATITLNRPDSLNAWTSSMDDEIRDAVERAAADPAVVGIVITGAGRAFCAGADMKMLEGIVSGDADLDGGDVRPAWADSTGDFDGRLTYLMTVDKPVIAAVNGVAAGMAFPFALCCDVRVVTPDTVFLTAFPQRGLIAEWGLAALLPPLVGPGAALDILFSSRKIGGEEAYRLGLANHVVEPDRLLAFCRDYVVDLAARCSPTSIAVMKRQVYAHVHRGLGDAERESQRLMVESFSRPDFAEGVRSFIEKRPPEFPRIGG